MLYEISYIDTNEKISADGNIVGFERKTTYIEASDIDDVLPIAELKGYYCPILTGNACTSPTSDTDHHKMNC